MTETAAGFERNAGAFGPARMISLGDLKPVIADDAFVAPGAVIIGDVALASGSSIWFNCVIRGDVSAISIGARSNVQDGSVIHAEPGYPVHIGNSVSIGHMAIVHGCTIQDGSLVGMGAIVMNGAVIEPNGFLAAGAMLTERRTIKSGELWAGRPAKYIRKLDAGEFDEMQHGVDHYCEISARLLPVRTLQRP